MSFLPSQKQPTIWPESKHKTRLNWTHSGGCEENHHRAKNTSKPNDNMRKLYALGCFRSVDTLLLLLLFVVLRVCSRYTNSFKTFKIFCELSVDYSSFSCFVLGFFSRPLFLFSRFGLFICYLFLLCLVFRPLSPSRFSSYYLIFVRQNIKKVFRSSLAVHYNQHLQCRTTKPIITAIGSYSV